MLASSHFTKQWFHVIQTRGSPESLRPFFESGISPNTQVDNRLCQHSMIGDHKYTLLTMACSDLVPVDIQMNLVRFLLDFEIDVNLENPEGWCALWYTFVFANKNLAVLLIEHGATVKENLFDLLFSAFGSTPNDLDDLVAEMIRQGELGHYINLPFDSSNGNTLLHDLVTVSVRHSRLGPNIRRLFELGFDANLQNKEGKNVLLVAFGLDLIPSDRDLPQVELVELLISFDPRQVLMENNEGHTAISVYHETLNWLIEIICMDSENIVDEQDRHQFIQENEERLREKHKPLLDLLLRVEQEALSNR